MKTDRFGHVAPCPTLRKLLSIAMVLHLLSCSGGSFSMGSADAGEDLEADDDTGEDLEGAVEADDEDAGEDLDQVEADEDAGEDLDQVEADDDAGEDLEGAVEADDEDAGEDLDQVEADEDAGEDLEAGAGDLVECVHVLPDPFPGNPSNAECQDFGGECEAEILHLGSCRWRLQGALPCDVVESCEADPCAIARARFCAANDYPGCPDWIECLDVECFNPGEPDPVRAEVSEQWGCHCMAPAAATTAEGRNAPSLSTQDQAYFAAFVDSLEQVWQSCGHADPLF